MTSIVPPAPSINRVFDRPRTDIPFPRGCEHCVSRQKNGGQMGAFWERPVQGSRNRFFREREVARFPTLEQAECGPGYERVVGENHAGTCSISCGYRAASWKRVSAYT